MLLSTVEQAIPPSSCFDRCLAMKISEYCWRQCCWTANTPTVFKLIPAYIGNSKQQILKNTIKSDENKKEKLSKNQASQILQTRCFESCPVLLFTKNYDNSNAFRELCSQDVLSKNSRRSIVTVKNSTSRLRFGTSSFSSSIIDRVSGLGSHSYSFSKSSLGINKIYVIKRFVDMNMFTIIHTPKIQLMRLFKNHKQWQ